LGSSCVWQMLGLGQAATPDSSARGASSITTYGSQRCASKSQVIKSHLKWLPAKSVTIGTLAVKTMAVGRWWSLWPWVQNLEWESYLPTSQLCPFCFTISQLAWQVGDAQGDLWNKQIRTNPAFSATDFSTVTEGCAVVREAVLCVLRVHIQQPDCQCSPAGEDAEEGGWTAIRAQSRMQNHPYHSSHLPMTRQRP
jgi:hypothetical protein